MRSYLRAVAKNVHDQPFLRQSLHRSSQKWPHKNQFWASKNRTIFRIGVTRQNQPIYRFGLSYSPKNPKKDILSRILAQETKNELTKTADFGLVLSYMNIPTTVLPERPALSVPMEDISDQLFPSTPAPEKSAPAFLGWDHQQSPHHRPGRVWEPLLNLSFMESK